MRWDARADANTGVEQREVAVLVKLQFLWKTSESQATNCPALYKTDDGRYVVQGPAAEMTQLRDVGHGEIAVIVPADVIERIWETS